MIGSCFSEPIASTEHEMPRPIFDDWWLLGGAITTLKKIYESVGMITPNVWKNKSHVPNHQPDYFVYQYPHQSPDIMENKKNWNHINVALSESGVPLNPRLHHHFPLIHISTCQLGRPQFQSTSSPTNTPKKLGTWRCRFVMGPQSSKSWMTMTKSIETYDDWGPPMT